MSGSFGNFVRIRRAILGLTQRDLAEKSGIKQPLIAAIETGRRQPSGSVRDVLTSVLEIRPSEALDARRDEIRELFGSVGLPEPRVFGSVARGDDDVRSDLDLIVEFTDAHDIIDLLALQQSLEDLLTVRVEIIDGRGDGNVATSARHEAVTL